MDAQERDRVLTACESGITELIAAAADAHQRLIAMAEVFGRLPEQLVRTDDGGLTASADDLVDSVRAARHAVRDVERIGRCWQQEVGWLRAQDGTPS